MWQQPNDQLLQSRRYCTHHTSDGQLWSVCAAVRGGPLVFEIKNRAFLALFKHKYNYSTEIDIKFKLQQITLRSFLTSNYTDVITHKYIKLYQIQTTVHKLH
jgi:hypothetical protein